MPYASRLWASTTGTIELRHATLRLRGATGLLNLETQASGVTGADPLHQDLQEGTLVSCGTMPAVAFEARKHTVASSAAGVDGAVVRLLGTKRCELHVQSERRRLTTPAPGPITTIAAFRDRRRPRRRAAVRRSRKAGQHPLPARPS
ncbi:MAG TPA: hypothetical protein VFD84_20075 [Candidatus Binatia bacterium]|nr:hypothetical protein [Candidatus Binatia bacterium]